MVTTKAVGEDGESRALAHLLSQGLTLVQSNYRVAAGPHARGGEIDLIVRERDGTLVFVEVKSRKTGRFGGAAASVSVTKQLDLCCALLPAGLCVAPGVPLRCGGHRGRVHRVAARRLRCGLSGLLGQTLGL